MYIRVIVLPGVYTNYSSHHALHHLIGVQEVSSISPPHVVNQAGRSSYLRSILSVSLALRQVHKYSPSSKE
jgi:hypothetical protein